MIQLSMARCEPFWNTICLQSETLTQRTISTEPLPVALMAFADHHASPNVDLTPIESLLRSQGEQNTISEKQVTQREMFINYSSIE